MDVVNEKSTAWVGVTFYDKDGVSEAPSTVTYRIDCLTTGTEIKADTAIGAAASVEIQVTPTENAIVGTTNSKEHRRLTITATYSASDQITSRFDYLVRNLKAIS